MTRYERIECASARLLPLIVLASLCTLAFAQTTKIHGMIKARNGATMIVQTTDSPSVVVLLTDKTQVGQIEGLLKVRRKEMSMAALIPGLEVQVEGTNNDQNQLVADSVRFQGNDLERAESIQAGLHQTQAQSDRNREELEQHNVELKAQNEALQAQQGQLKGQQAQLTAQCNGSHYFAPMLSL